jgi:hypothetical protein
MKLKSLVYESQIFIKRHRSRRKEGCRLVRILESSDVLEEYSSNIIMAGNGRVEDFHARFKIKKAKLGYHLVETPLQHTPGHLTLQVFQAASGLPAAVFRKPPNKCCDWGYAGSPYSEKIASLPSSGIRSRSCCKTPLTERR